MNEHESTRAEIPAFVGGRLEPEARGRVETHLRECPRCADLVNTWEDLAGALRDGGEELFEEHPPAAALRRYAAGATDRGLARHLEVCAACELEVSAWRRRGAAATPSGSPPAAAHAPATMPAWRALAAGLVLGLGLASLGWWALAPGDGEPWSGSAPLLALEGPLRGAEAPGVPLSEERPYLLLAAVLSAEVADDGQVQFAILAEGSEVWAAALPAAEVRRQLSSSGVVSLLVPSAGLEPGPHTLTVSGAGTNLALPFDLYPAE